ncbi:MAG: BlaI/MecI/CopY family transcriptional regulator [Mycobacteriales bacterium]
MSLEPRQPRRDRGGLENEVHAVLAASRAPLTPRQVQEALGGGLAYTTVLTALSRLYAKGTLVREPAGRAFAYAPAAPAERAAAHMRWVLDTASDRDAVLARFLSELPDDDVPALLRLLSGEGHG